MSIARGRPGNVRQFLLVSSSTPSPYEFGLGLANGYALAIVSITHVSDHQNHDGNYEWQVQPSTPVVPFPVKGHLHFYDVDDSLIQTRDELVPAMQAYHLNSESPDAVPFLTAILDPLIAIGIRQMPRKYQKILQETDDWNAVIRAWQLA